MSNRVFFCKKINKNKWSFNYLKVFFYIMAQDYDAKINLHLDINHGLDRVTELVQTRLIECGWRDQVRLACRKAITENEKHIPTVDELIAIITPKARSMVPDSVKRELLHELESILINVDKFGYSKSF